MATGLDVWISTPGNVCRVDDGAWTVTVYDAHENVFSWAGMSYAALAAPQGHWAGAIPPGTYVVRATRKQGDPTDRAVVAVDCQQVACVRLYVGGGKTRRHPDRPQPDCRISISTVRPVARGEMVAAVDVQGDAQGCETAELTVECGERSVSKSVKVASNGRWKVKLDTRELECQCGDAVRVTVHCSEDPGCFDVQQVRLDCEPDKAAPPR